MMGLVSHMVVFLVFLLSCFHIIVLSNSISSALPLCRVDESSALLQFKQSFSINKRASVDPFSYPKVDSWRVEGKSSNCCSWDGVECDDDSGHVIGLDLSSSLLYGFINSNSSLFSLTHLQRLNLADNHFNYSEIPSEIARLSRLTSLNLSLSVFSGQIPPQVLDLSNLTVLDLSDCGLYGEFPRDIFHLPKLRTLWVNENRKLTGYLPELNQNSTLEDLRLFLTSFSGKLPDSIGNVKTLKQLHLGWCNFTGLVPTSIGNLIQLTILDLAANQFIGPIPPSVANLTQLTALSLSNNSFTSGQITWIGKQTELYFLSLYDNNLYGEIPSSIGNLTRLNYLLIFNNDLTGEIPSWLGNLTKLIRLDLSGNQFHGSIPQSIFELTNLSTLNLQFNNLNGTLEQDKFLKLNLRELQLTGNKLSVNTHGSLNATIPKFSLLGLASCNLTGFPEFLRYQDEMQWLELSNNNIHGPIPNWIWNIGIKTLVYMRIAANFLTSFQEVPAVLPWERLQNLDLSYNTLKGSLPIPPPSTIIYQVSNNLLTGEIPELICNTTSLFVLDLSNNSLSGAIPQCLSHSIESLTVMDLHSNNFQGPIPKTYNKANNLRVIDMSQNYLDGVVPKSLANCTMLESFNLGNNQINDTFPFWLGALQKLKILLLRYNHFHGSIAGHLSNFGFPMLHIVDLSNNGFTGELPSKYFQNWNDRSVHDIGQPIYLEASTVYLAPGYQFSESFTFSMRIKNKGLETFYSKILIVFAAIDLSCNKFSGGIPNSVENLKGLQLLNISNNCLTGNIPSLLGSLTDLQALDLSHNNFSGEIPQQLRQLTFLAFLNVSDNNLTGPIPRGNQFGTFDNSSFEGNPGLCGDPLSKKCGILEPLSPPPLTFENENSSFPSKFDWIFIGVGYASGLAVGLLIGHILTTSKIEWFLRTFAWRRNT